MRKTLLLLALGAFFSVSTAANACDGEKTAAKGKGGDCCMKGKKAMSAKECAKDPKCMKAMKNTKTAAKKETTKS
ncbi:MAG: hypothetical protein WCH46_08275 [bacterium]